MTLLQRAALGLTAFAVATVLLVIGYRRAEPVAEAKDGGFRALGAIAADYAPMPLQISTERLTTEVLAVEAVREFFEREGAEPRSVKCQRRMSADYCSVCLDHPRGILAAVLVRCSGDQCRGPVDLGEEERIGWNAERACGRQYAGLGEWNAE